MERLGSVSPTKLDRKVSAKKPSFKPVSLNKQFLKEPAACTTATASVNSTLQPKGILLRYTPSCVVLRGYPRDGARSSRISIYAPACGRFQVEACAELWFHTVPQTHWDKCGRQCIAG